MFTWNDCEKVISKKNFSFVESNGFSHAAMLHWSELLKIIKNRKSISSKISYCLLIDSSLAIFFYLEHFSKTAKCVENVKKPSIKSIYNFYLKPMINELIGV